MPWGDIPCGSVCCLPFENELHEEDILDTVPHTHFVDSVMTPFVDSVTHFVDSVTHFVDSATHLLIL